MEIITNFIKVVRRLAFDKVILIFNMGYLLHVTGITGITDG
jgi:hypothetical protein